MIRSLLFSLQKLLRISWFLAVPCILVVASGAQVRFNGGHTYVNFGSQAAGITSPTVSLSFTVAAGTKVRSIEVLTTGIEDKDFANAPKSTCIGTTYTATTTCVVNVSFTPLATGLRLGAVVFYSPGKNGSALVTVPVYGVGIGPQIAFAPSGPEATVGTKLMSPLGAAVDAAGNVFITDIGLQEVFKITPGGTQTTVGSGLEVPQSVAVDGAGNVYIADSQYPAVFKVTPTGVQTMIGSGFDWPSGVAVDGEGNVYVSDPYVDVVFKITPAGKQTTVGGGYNTPAGLAVDATGNLYVADTYAATVFKIAPDGTQTTIGKRFTSPTAVAVDAAADVYVTDSGTDSVYEVAPDGTQSTLTTGLDVPDGIAIDGSGNLYLANTYDRQVLKIDRADAPSLKFDSTVIGSTSADSPRKVDVENIGTSSLQFFAATFPADFPEGSSSKATRCESTTSLAPASTCIVSIDFQPVRPLGSKPAVVLKEAVSLATDNLNMSSTQKLNVSGTELAGGN
jgi:large repetitive protein